MENELNPYECQFSIEERKQMTANMLRELRIRRNLSQKQVAAIIKSKPTTYNTYESGRTEPPMEVLVRLSYLYKVPIDTMVQKERLYRTAEDLKQMLAECREQLSEIDRQIAVTGTDNPAILAMRDAVMRMADNLQELSNRQDVQSGLQDYQAAIEN